MYTTAVRTEQRQEAVPDDTERGPGEGERNRPPDEGTTPMR